MMGKLWSAVLVSGVGLCGCRAEPAEPAPAPASYELVVAPPGARGARAAGTDAAPPPPSEGDLAAPGTEDEVEPEAEPEFDPGGGLDGGLFAPDAAGVAL